MPLVFVHGVHTRKGESAEEQARYYQTEDIRTRMFLAKALADYPRARDEANPIRIFNPYWGDFGARFDPNLASLPRMKTETFGSDDAALFDAVCETLPIAAVQAMAPSQGGVASRSPPAEDSLLVTVSRETSLADALEVLTAACMAVPTAAAENDARVAFLQSALDYAEQNQHPPWLIQKDRFENFTVATDSQLLAKLTTLLPGQGSETFGGPNLFQKVLEGLHRVGKRAASGLAGALGGTVAGGLLLGVPGIARALRPTATRHAGMFLGDVFEYLTHRDDPANEIHAELRKDIEAAARLRAPDDPLILVAHSLGGVLLYDLLTHYWPQDNLPAVDVLVTVGSQVALFKDMGQYAEDRAGRRHPPPAEEDVPAPAAREAVPARGLIPRPSCVARWINVFDPLDVLGFTTEGVFDGVENYTFDNRATVLSSHGRYWARRTAEEAARAAIEATRAAATRYAAEDAEAARYAAEATGNGVGNELPLLGSAQDRINISELWETKAMLQLIRPLVARVDWQSQATAIWLLPFPEQTDG